MNATTLELQFNAALAAYLAHADEALLGRAYELGRTALNEGRSIPEVVAMHSRALRAIAKQNGDRKGFGQAMDAATAFLSEALSSFEMTHRGYRDAIAALRHLNETLEQEARRIAHALHDEAGQLLVSVHLALAELEPDLPPAAHGRLRNVQGLLDQVEHQLRQLSHELRPTVLDDLGWLPAIRFLADGVSKRARLAVQVQSTIDGRLPAAIETVLYRTVQEALTNATRHAKAKHVSIEVMRESSQLRCLIADDGVGFDVAARGNGGLGLRGMRERLNAVNGRLDITSSPGNGTQLRLLLPMENFSEHTRHSGR